MSKKLQGKVALVTGASQGLGQAFASSLAQAGADLVLVDINSTAETEKLVTAAGQRCLSMKCDVSNEAQVQEVAKQVDLHFGRCDIVVNNAGIIPLTPFDELDLADWKRTFAINVEGPFLMCKAFVPGMKKHGWGRIINIASAVFWTRANTGVHYPSTKAAVIGFTRALADELAQFGITVNAIAPGITLTTGTANSDLAAKIETVATTRQAIKRVGVPADFEGAVVFLASDDSAFITAQTLCVDGGMTRH